MGDVFQDHLRERQPLIEDEARDRQLDAVLGLGEARDGEEQLAADRALAGDVGCEDLGEGRPEVPAPKNGEGGIAPSPGGQAQNSDTRVFAQSTDHRPGAQGNLSAGHSPPWHGASAAAVAAQGQANAAALSGWKTQEFGGEGFNQLVFDDSNQQLRVQMATTQAASQLNLGHLLHQADNHRGSFRGLGFELRTDAYGAVRAKQGVLISSYGTQASEPAGDNAAGIALANQLKTLGKTFSDAAGTHQTVKLATHIGSTQASASTLSDKEAPHWPRCTPCSRAWWASASLDEATGDAGSKNVSAGEGKLPHTTDPVVAIAAKAGLGVVAGQDLQWSAGETITLASGQDTHLASGGAMRIHTGQAIGMLAGAVQAGDQAAGKGITLIAGQGEVEFQAQADKMQVAAKTDVTVQSATAHIDWAAAKRIVLSTAGGANVTLEGGNITVQCPGKITVRAGQKSFCGAGGAERIRLPAIAAACLHLVPVWVHCPQGRGACGDCLTRPKTVTYFAVDSATPSAGGSQPLCTRGQPTEPAGGSVRAARTPRCFGRSGSIWTGVVAAGRAARGIQLWCKHRSGFLMRCQRSLSQHKDDGSQRCTSMASYANCVSLISCRLELNALARAADELARQVDLPEGLRVLLRQCADDPCSACACMRQHSCTPSSTRTLSAARQSCADALPPK